MGNPATGCTCGSGAHPRECKLHPEYYRLHIAELNVEAHLPEDPEAQTSMDELIKAIQGALGKSQKEIERLTRLVFQTNSNVKSYSLMKFWRKDQNGGFGGVADYEVWLRRLDHTDLDRLIRLHTGAMDAIRYRRRLIQNEAERRHLHSSYGKYPAEFLFELEEVP